MEIDFEIDDNLKINLLGLKNIVDRLWGCDSKTMGEAITRGKALLEMSNWNKKPTDSNSKG